MSRDVEFSKISGLELLSAVPDGARLLAAYNGRNYAVLASLLLSLQFDIRSYGASVSASAAVNTTAINAAVAAANTAGGGVVLVARGTYTCNGCVLKSNVELRLEPGAVLKLAAGANAHVVTVEAGATGVTIRGGALDGTKVSNAGGHGIAALAGSSRVAVFDCYVHDCSADGIRFTSSSNSLVSGCILTSNAAHGLTGDSLAHFSWVNNLAQDNGFHGIGMIGPCSYGTITGNVARGNGSTAPFADQITGYNAANHHITIVGNACYAGGNNGIHIGGSYVSIMGNIIDTPTQYGIVHFNHDLSVSTGVVISGNVINGCPQSGIWLDHVEGGTVSGNSVRDCTGHGIYLATDCVDVAITGNQCRSNGGGGIRVVTCNAIAITGNTCRANDNGIHLSNTSLQCVVSGNALFANTTRGMYLVATTETLVSGNNCKDNGKPVEEDLTSDLNVYTGNDFAGNSAVTPILVGASNQWRDNNNGGTASIASAAAFAIPIYTDYIVCTGTTTVTSITGGNWRNRVITLRFDSNITITDGSNLLLAGDFNATSNDTLTLRGDGSNWYEMSRSVN